jgi:thioredoxin reductase
LANKVVAAALVCFVGVLTSAVAAQIPAKFTNLQVLPKDIQRPELLATMKNFALNLGVRCEHCHVGEGNDLSKFDFAADTKPAKATARRMLRMTMDLNKQVAEIGEPAAAGAPKITCFTCHRGATKPLTAPGGG